MKGIKKAHARKTRRDPKRLKLTKQYNAKSGKKLSRCQVPASNLARMADRCPRLFNVSNLGCAGKPDRGDYS